jgi:hypothetical protein
MRAAMSVLKRVVIVLVITFVVAVFGLFAFNFYRQTFGDDPGARPPVIYERSDRPARA